jgi:hypothetical protein
MNPKNVKYIDKRKIARIASDFLGLLVSIWFLEPDNTRRYLNLGQKCILFER